MDSHGFMTTILEESETETSNPTTDQQQIQVLVHRSVSFNKDETEEKGKDCDILVNKYINDNSEVFVSRAVGESEDGGPGVKEEDVVVVSDVQEIKNESKYSTVVCNVVTKVKNQTLKTMESIAKTTEIMPKEREDSERNDNSEASSEMCNNSNTLNAIVERSNAGELSSEKESVVLQKEDRQAPLVKEMDLLPGFPVEPQVSTSEVQEVVEKRRRKISSQSIAASETSESHSLTREDKTIFQELEEMLKEKEDRLKVREEKLKEREEKLKEKEEKLNLKEIMTNTLPKSKNISDNKGTVLEDVVNKSPNNGCFGNIFSSSKRPSNSISTTGNRETVKSESVHPSSKSHKAKDSLNIKSATWEKCRKAQVFEASSSLSKTSLEISTDLKHLPLHTQKSPPSITSTINGSGQALVENGEQLCSTNESLNSQAFLESAESVLEVNSMKGSEDYQQDIDYDASIDSGFISKYDIVTYL